MLVMFGLSPAGLSGTSIDSTAASLMKNVHWPQSGEMSVLTGKSCPHQAVSTVVLGQDGS